MRTFQERNQLFVDGEVGEDTYGALASFYDARGVKLLNFVKDASPDTIRRKIAKAAHTGYVNRDEISYTQEAGTRMDGILRERRPPDFPGSRIAHRSRSGATGRRTLPTRTEPPSAAAGPDPC